MDERHRVKLVVLDAEELDRRGEGCSPVRTLERQLPDLIERQADSRCSVNVSTFQRSSVGHSVVVEFVVEPLSETRRGERSCTRFADRCVRQPRLNCTFNYQLAGGVVHASGERRGRRLVAVETLAAVPGGRLCGKQGLVNR